MIRSMTAFAREEKDTSFGAIIWELRSVNHRYLDVSLRLPEDFRFIEAQLRARAGAKLARGKVECTLKFQAAAGTADSFSVNAQLVGELLAAAEEVAARAGQAAPVNPLDVLRWPGVMESARPDQEALAREILDAFDVVLARLVAAREREGAALREMVEQRCVSLVAEVAKVKRRLPEVAARVREKLLSRLAELTEQADPGRLEQELALIAQRVDVAEEMDRLAAHIDEVRRVLAEGGAAGRRLDFLMQELNREANTLASKSADVDTTRSAVDMKVLIEQMREQVQNIE
ncbi:MAG TPA: YicC family protein [Gammaproteobacteria bacterium]|nr:YicC family protein [Gammaproteobacteria bacterium]